MAELSITSSAARTSALPRYGLDTSSTTVLGNLIGTQADGTNPLGNGRNGVRRNTGNGSAYADYPTCEYPNDHS